MAKTNAICSTPVARVHGTDRRPAFLAWVTAMHADGYIFERRARNGEPNDFAILRAGAGRDDTAEMAAAVAGLPA